MSDSTIVTKELLFGLRACTESIYIVKNNDMWGRPASEILDVLEQNGIDDAREWWAEQGKTVDFVRLTGSVFTMNEKFQLYNPLIGQHEQFEDINSAKARIVEIATQICNMHKPTLMTELINEHGDAVWTNSNETIKLIACISNES